MFINIHTHGHDEADTWALHNLHASYSDMQIGKCYSLGIHPWFIQEVDAQLNELEAYISNMQVLAVGECGLDSICKTDFALQEKVFARQVIMANKINKPLIIHCVKAYAQVLHILQTNDNKVPVIFHGFNRNQQLALHLIQKGYYLSFGKVVFSPAMAVVIRQIPPHRILFENDDSSLPVSAIYEKAAVLLEMSVNTLSLQVQHNAEKLLNISF